MSEDATHSLRDAALALGLDLAEVDRAEADGTLELVALERLVADDEPRFHVGEVSARADLDAERVLVFWRALGFPDPRPNERIFTRSDADMLASVVRFIEAGALDQTLALQIARVVGSSLNRIATAQVDAVQSQAAGDGAGPPRGAGVDRDPHTVLRSAHVVPLMPRILEMVWRRHLATAARRRIVRATAEKGRKVCVGFADLVGFTAQTQELPESQLAVVVGRFETLAYDLVAAHDARVVKMIGDEVLFVSDDVHSGATLALAMAAAFRRDEHLSDVRVGLASGRVLERDGDVFGSVVNRASRIVHIAYPGTVVVSQDVRDTLAHDPRFALRDLRRHYLKDIGRVPLWALRAADAPAEEPYVRERRRRARRGARVLEPLDEETAARLAQDDETARRLHELETEALELAEKADRKADKAVAETEREARRKVEELEAKARQRVEETLRKAGDAARKASEDADRRIARAAAAARRKAEAAKAKGLRKADRKTRRAETDPVED